MDRVIKLLVESMDQAFIKRSWHGTNLCGSIRGLSVEIALWRPCENRHNVWEIVIHTAYWKYTVWRRLVGERRGLFPIKGSNWIARPVASDSAEESIARWKTEMLLLKKIHYDLRDAVAGLRPENLERPAIGGRTLVKDLVTGIIAHDLYHAGQIQLLKRLFHDNSLARGDAQSK